EPLEPASRSLWTVMLESAEEGRQAVERPSRMEERVELGALAQQRVPVGLVPIQIHGLLPHFVPARLALGNDRIHPADRIAHSLVLLPHVVELAGPQRLDP